MLCIFFFVFVNIFEGNEFNFKLPNFAQTLFLATKKIPKNFINNEELYRPQILWLCCELTVP